MIWQYVLFFLFLIETILFYMPTETAQAKANYIAMKNLGGAAIHDLNNDDFRGSCTGDKFPILRATKYRLQQPN